jgi:hypothetical protein
MAMKTITTLSSLVLVATAACSSPQAPAQPNWFDDVQPIIQGSCGHCHGQTAAVTGSSNRFDVCDPAPFVEAGYSFPIATKAGALRSSQVTVIAGEVSPSEGGRALMPPPPGGELSAYERDVLINWANKPSCPKRPGNHKPTVKLVGKLNYTGGNLVLSVDVQDADMETVLGSVTAGPTDAPVATGQITATGRNKVTLTGVTADDQPVHVKVSDGTDLIEKDL